MTKKYKEIIKFGGVVDSKTNNILAILGAVVILIVWYLVTLTGDIIPPKILPTPISVFKGFKVLFFELNILKEIWYSVSLSLIGYSYAILLAVPLGFIIGIYPLPKGLFQRYTDGLRYLPPPAITGIFIAIFGISFGMKTAFLAFAVFISLLVSVIQKIEDLQNPKNDKDYVYLQTIKTLGANNWQKFTKVYFPYVMGRVFTDIINLTAVTWTYIIVCEKLNKEGGVGAMIHTLDRQALVPLIYGILFLIVLIGITWDFLLKRLDKWLFPYKYNGVVTHKSSLFKKIKGIIMVDEDKKKKTQYSKKEK